MVTILRMGQFFIQLMKGLSVEIVIKWNISHFITAYL